MNKILSLIFLYLILIQYGAANEKQFFSIANLNLRKSSSVNSEGIAKVPNGTILNVVDQSKEKEKIDVFNDYWYKVTFAGKTGWLYGGYLVEYTGQDIQEFIKRFELIRYFKDGKIWDLIDKKKDNFYELYLGFGQYDKNLNTDDLELNIQVKGRRILGVVIGRFDKVTDGYNLSSKEEYVETDKGYIKKEKGKYTKKGDFIARIGIKNNKLIIYDIKEMLSEKDGKKFNSLELKGFQFDPAFIVNGYGGYNFSK